MFKNGRQSFRCKPLHFFVLTLPYLTRSTVTQFHSTRNRPVAVFKLPLDVVRRIVILALSALRLVKEAENMVVAMVDRHRGAKLLAG